VNEQHLYGAIEGGGTKFVCAVACSPSEILESTVIGTRDAAATLNECVTFFINAQQRHGAIAAFGFSCFGPLDLRPESAGYGRMMATPKPGWSRADVIGPLRHAFDVPIALDTDVAGAALAEWQLGAGRGCGSLAYVTVGTGIGAAVVPQPAAPLMHAEMGHIPVRRHPRDSNFKGLCPFHTDCLEGLASGPTILGRWGTTLDALPEDHECFSILASYLGQLAAVIALTHSVERIVFGGGVMTNSSLIARVRAWTSEYLNGYLEPLNDADRWERYICSPALGHRAGLTGSVLLAMSARQSDR
jgi:fructokinase